LTRNSTGDILRVVRELAAEKMTMVIVTHEMLFARDVADRVIFMDEGIIAEQGDAQSLINNPQSPALKGVFKSTRINSEPGYIR
jgi:polar amino acid transport system ATP-binding protein